MKIFYFLNSFPGQYLVQSLVHSLIAVIIVDFALIIWRIEKPSLRQRLRFVVVAFPVVSFPLYQVVNPERGNTYFRLNEALFDTTRLLTIEIWGKVPVSIILFIIILLTVVVFLIQEFVPVVKQFMESGNEELEQSDDPHYKERVMRALAALPERDVNVSVIEDEDHLIFSTTGRNPVIYITTGLIDDLDDEQLKAALAHEVAHIIRNRRPLLIVVFFLRVIMFYNPVTLVEFRRIVEEEEKICDDVAISWTRRPDVLVETLNKFYIQEESLKDNRRKGFESIEEYSHNMLIKGRIDRLVMGEGKNVRWFWIKFLAVFSSIVIINYYIV